MAHLLQIRVTSKRVWPIGLTLADASDRYGSISADHCARKQTHTESPLAGSATAGSRDHRGDVTLDPLMAQDLPSPRVVATAQAPGGLAM